MDLLLMELLELLLLELLLSSRDSAAQIELLLVKADVPVRGGDKTLFF
jgi:hypothetical protein